MGFDSLVRVLNVGGFAMLTHLASCLVLWLRLRGDDELASALFSDFGVTRRFLLRARFLAPWVPLPVGLSGYASTDKALFWLARLSGVATVVAMLVFVLLGVFLGAKR